MTTSKQLFTDLELLQLGYAIGNDKSLTTEEQWNLIKKLNKVIR